MIDTERLILRPWRDSDRAPFHAMSCDPAVMATLGPLQTRAQSDAAIDSQIAVQARLGHCFWAIERCDDAAFLGFCGLKIAPDAIPGIEGAIDRNRTRCDEGDRVARVASNGLDETRVNFEGASNEHPKRRNSDLRH